MNKLIQYASLAALVGAGIGVAQADTVETKGGLKVKTDDGRFEMSIGGRIMFDYYGLSEDENAVATDANRSVAFGSGAAAQHARSSTYFRRLYLTLKGKAYGWSYKLEPDFSGNSTNNVVPASNANNTNTGRDIAFQDVYISHTLGPGEVFIGQMKPFRGMEELTSSNDITLMERPFASAAGIFNGGSSREFQEGIFYKADVGDFLLGASFFDLRRDNTAPTEGLGYNARAVYAPMRADGQVLHVGVSWSDENPQTNDIDTAAGASVGENVGSQFNYAGRRGPSVVFLTGGSEHARTVGGEFGASLGSATLQAEYMLQKLDQAKGASPGTQDVPAWYVQASYFITGEKKPYKKGEGIFGAPKPNNEFGAVELAVRYDAAENKDSNAGCNIAATTGATPLPAIIATECSVSSITAGANWYVNPNVRFMLNYIHGENDRGFAKDKPDVVTARAQFAF